MHKGNSSKALWEEIYKSVEVFLTDMQSDGYNYLNVHVSTWETGKKLFTLFDFDSCAAMGFVVVLH